MNTQPHALAEVARRLLNDAESATLATHSQSRPGFPFPSLVQFALDSKGRPLFILSGLAEHTKNLLADPRASLFVHESRSGETQAQARVTVMGKIQLLPEADVPSARDEFLTRHPRAAMWMGFGDFRWFRLETEATYVVAGFGQMGWIE